jgi:hypothetical protein
LKGATVVDGTGAAPFTADVGVQDGRIAEVGRIGSAARERIDGHGAWLTPGFVDIHTHYDGQATWDETFSPSIHHGVTTLLMGNCGVGFAPNVPGREAELIALMEGVEDIPGAALAEGVRSTGEFWRLPGRAAGDAAQPGLPGPGAARPAAHGGDGRACAGAGGRHTQPTSPRCKACCAPRCRPAPPASPPAAPTTTAPRAARRHRRRKPRRPN